jgi:hypothetical protein
MLKLPLLSREALHVLNSLLPGARGAQQAIGFNPAIDHRLVIEEMTPISRDIVRQDKEKQSSYVAKLAMPVREILFQKAALDYVAPPKTDDEKQQNMSRPDRWFQKLRDAVRIIIPFVITYLREIYTDEAHAVNPDFNNGEEANNARFEAGAWKAVVVLFLAADHVALNCLHLKTWHDMIWKNTVKRPLQILSAALVEETALPYERI